MHSCGCRVGCIGVLGPVSALFWCDVHHTIVVLGPEVATARQAEHAAHGRHAAELFTMREWSSMRNMYANRPGRAPFRLAANPDKVAIWHVYCVHTP